MVIIFGMIAFAVDMGYITFVGSQLQRSADAASHAAVIELVKDHDADATFAVAQEMAKLNPAAGEDVDLTTADVLIGRRELIPNTNPVAYNYVWGEVDGANAIKVIARRTEGSSMGPFSLFFAPVLGINKAEAERESVAVLAPRDIVFVIDVSGSMHHDTEPWAINALNWLSTDSNGVGAGDAAMQVLFKDLGWENVVPYPLPDTEQYRWNMSDRSGNMKINLPGSPSDYTSISVENNNGTPQARLNISDVKNMLKSKPFVVTQWNGSKTKIADSDWSKYAWKDSNDGSLDVKAYDFIIDKILPTTMASAKPSLASQANRDAYRSYWRAYLNYTRASSGLNSGRTGDGGSTGIQGYTNPSDQVYTRPDGTTYPNSQLDADVAALYNHVDYMTYIQFMMDMSYNRKPGLNMYGSADTSSNRKYTPLSGQFTGSSSDAFRFTDSSGFERIPREQPMGSLVDAVIAGLNQIQEDNPDSVPPSSRDHVALVIFAQTYMSISQHPTQAGNPFSYDYDALKLVASKLQAEYEVGASTNTHGGLTQAFNDLNSDGRNYANRVVVLFSDGVPNTGSTPGPLDSTTKIDTDGNGSLDSNYYYSNTTSNKYQNAALNAAQKLNNSKTIVHTVCAGGGRDTDLLKRMSLLSRGIARDSGSNLHEYAANLEEDIKDLANAKVPKLTIIGTNDTETSN
jgi:Mg-chelatase subunit ChlD